MSTKETQILRLDAVPRETVGRISYLARVEGRTLKETATDLLNKIAARETSDSLTTAEV